MSDKDTELEKVAQVLDQQAVVIRKLVAENALGNEDFLKARPDEVWQEADGCLLTRGYNGWWAFGVEDEFSDKEILERVALPLRRLLLSDGTLDPAYTSNGIAKRRQLVKRSSLNQNANSFKNRVVVIKEIYNDYFIRRRWY